MNSIGAKMFLAFGLLSLAAIGLITLAAAYTSSLTIKKNAAAYVTDSIRHADENLRVMLDEVDKITTVVSGNAEIFAGRLAAPSSEPSYEWFLEQKESEDFLASLISYRSYISRIAVIGLNGTIYQSGAPMLLKRTVNAPWFRQILNENRPHLLYNASAEGAVTLARPLYYESMAVGIVLIDLAPAHIRQLYDIEPLTGSIVMLLARDGTIVYHSDRSLINRNTAQLYAPELYAHSGSAATTLDIDGKPHLVVRYTSDDSGWQTIGAIPQNRLLYDAWLFRKQMILISFLVLVAVLVVSIIVSRRISTNLRRLRNSMKLVAAGHLAAKPNISSKDEVGQLSEMFTSMMGNIQSLMNEIREGERLKREAELKALQSQIHPHFLYNTLNTIRYLAKLQHVSNIEEVSGSLMEMLRGQMAQKNELVTIREELDYVKQYVAIQKYRYMSDISFTYDIESQTEECLIPKLIIQPLVENSLVHGVGRTDMPGFVSVRAFREGASVCLEVTDNGKGFPEDGQDNDSESNGIGLRNVNERLRLAFGEAAGLRIYSQPGMMTTVSLLIPIIRRNENDTQYFAG